MASGVAIGALMGTCFALGWAIAGVQGLGSRWWAPALSISVVVSALIGAALLLRLRAIHTSAAAGRFNGATYGWAVTLQSLAIVITVIALRRGAHGDYIMSAVALIVGAHFFGLAGAMVGGSGQLFVWVGALICISAAIIILALARSVLSPAQSMALTGFSSAIILWASAVSTLI
jgi:hypothetical protein